MAPTRKANGEARRRNADQKNWTQMEHAPSAQKPKLPTKKPVWRKATKDWWDQVWDSPMAALYLEADVDSLIRLAYLKDDWARGYLPITALAHIMRLEDAFGLSPKGRRALQWEVGKRKAEQSKSQGNVVSMAERRNLKVT